MSATDTLEGRSSSQSKESDHDRYETDDQWPRAHDRILVVYAKVYVPGDAATTAGNLIANSGLVRMGVVADLVQATVWVFLALTLYQLLKLVNKSVASAMVVLVAIGAGIVMLNEVFGFEALRVATGAVSLAPLGSAGSNALALLLVDAQHYGLLIAQIFFGLWLVPLGYLAYKSGWFPKVLGIVLILGALCYIVDMLALFLVPDFGKAVHGFVTIPSAIAEISMVVYPVSYTHLTLPTICSV